MYMIGLTHEGYEVDRPDRTGTDEKVKSSGQARKGFLGGSCSASDQFVFEKAVSTSNSDILNLYQESLRS
jgi:hypothetical protein